MTHTVYKTVNKINGKFYIGVHKTDNPNDEYLGSGTYIQRAVVKYGASSFEKQILFEFETQEEAWDKENELVELYRSDPLCKNLRKGGSGGFDYINHLPEVQSIRSKAGKVGGKVVQERHPGINRDFLSLGCLHPDSAARGPLEKKQEWNRLGVKSWKGRTLSQEIRNRLSRDRKGQGNNQFGTFWITDGEENRKLRVSEVPPAGWFRGRVLKSRVVRVALSI